MDCYKVYQLVGLMRSGLNWLQNHESDYSQILDDHFIKPISDIVDDFGNYEELIEKSLDMQKIEQGEFIINSRFSSD